MDKKAQMGSQITFIGFILLMVIVGVGIVIGTYYFVSEVDFRQAEANLMNSKTANCLADKNLSGLNANIENNAKLMVLYNLCDLNPKAMESKHWVKICVNAKDDDECIKNENPLAYSAGSGIVISACGLADKSSTFPKCMISSITKEGNKYTIIAISDQKIRRNAR